MTNSQTKSKKHVSEHGEVFTGKREVNAMLDLVKKETNKIESRFLEPTCGNGNFLVEILKRKLKAVRKRYSKNQIDYEHFSILAVSSIFGIDLLSDNILECRERLYNIVKKNYLKRFSDNCNDNFLENVHNLLEKNILCGDALTLVLNNLEPIDVIIGNPPYHLDTGGSRRQAIPIYQLFIQQAKKLNPRYISMIIPSRWFSGGFGLSDFRKEMLNDRHIAKITYFTDAKDCFPQISISGGVCYFLWTRAYDGDCLFTNVNGNSINTTTRDLREFPVIIRYNEAIEIIRKVAKNKEVPVSKITSSTSPFGLLTSIRGSEIPFDNSIALHSSTGVSYIAENTVSKGNKYFGKYKVLLSQTGADRASAPNKYGKFQVLISSMKVIGQTDVCTKSYILIGAFDSYNNAQNAYEYLKTKFVRFLILQAITSIHISKHSFIFVPIQDFSELWTDEKLYTKYGLTESEVRFIESIIRTM